MDHPVLGRIEFDPTDGTWSTVNHAPVFHGGIPGDTNGPDPDRVAEILTRLGNVEQYWQACSDDLLYIASTFASLPDEQDPRKLYRVVALSLYPTYWELCFETFPQYRWLYVGMQFEGEELVSNTIDT